MINLYYFFYWLCSNRNAILIPVLKILINLFSFCLQIRVGLEFVGNTSATLRNPANIESAGSYSTLSMYVQTRQKRALLGYVGADMMPNRVTPVSYQNYCCCKQSTFLKKAYGDGNSNITGIILKHCCKPANGYINCGLRICQACHINGYIYM